MLTYYEERIRHPKSLLLYKVRCWYFLGVRVLKRWEQLTTCASMSLQSERE